MVTLAALIALAPVERCAVLSAPDWRKRVTAIPALEREVVLAPDAPTDEDLKDLAAALHADLARVGDEWRLTRSDATRDALRKADHAWMKDQLEKAVARADQLAQPYAKSPVGGPFAAMLAARAKFDARTSNDVIDEGGWAAHDVAPAARLLADLLRRLPESALDTVPCGGLVTLSNAPVGEEALLSSTDGPLADYAVAEERFSEWSEKAGDEIPKAYRWAFAPSVYRPGGRTIQLYVGRSDLEPTFGLATFDPTGRREAVALQSAREPENARDLAPRGASGLGQAALPPETAAALRDAPSGTPGLPSDPGVRDPLDLYVRDALLLWARAKGYHRVVACVPDILLEGVKRCVNGASLDLDALTGSLDRLGCESLAIGKTLVIRPAQPLQEEAQRIDRRPLSNLYRAVSRGTYRLQDLFAYHAAYTDTYETRWMLSRMEKPFWNAFGIGSPTAGNVPHAVLATLGTIPTSAQRTWSSGGRISLDSPAFAACRRALARYVASSGKSSVTSAPDDPVPPGAFRYTPATATLVGSDLDRTEDRVLARPGPRWLEILPSTSYPLIRRVSKTDGKVLDAKFTSIGMFVGGPFAAERRRNFDQNYLALWTEERSTSVRILFGPGVEIGPFVLRESSGVSHGPVPLDRVPGIQLPKAP